MDTEDIKPIGSQIDDQIERRDFSYKDLSNAFENAKKTGIVKSQAECAEKLGINRRTFSRYVSGERPLSEERLKVLIESIQNLAGGVAKLEFDQVQKSTTENFQKALSAKEKLLTKEKMAKAVIDYYQKGFLEKQWEGKGLCLKKIGLGIEHKKSFINALKPYSKVALDKIRLFYIALENFFKHPSDKKQDLQKFDKTKIDALTPKNSISTPSGSQEDPLIQKENLVKIANIIFNKGIEQGVWINKLDAYIKTGADSVMSRPAFNRLFTGKMISNRAMEDGTEILRKYLLTENRKTSKKKMKQSVIQEKPEETLRKFDVEELMDKTLSSSSAEAEENVKSDVAVETEKVFQLAEVLQLPGDGEKKQKEKPLAVEMEVKEPARPTASIESIILEIAQRALTNTIGIQMNELKERLATLEEKIIDRRITEKDQRSETSPIPDQLEKISKDIEYLLNFMRPRLAIENDHANEVSSQELNEKATECNALLQEFLHFIDFFKSLTLDQQEFLRKRIPKHNLHLIGSFLSMAGQKETYSYWQDTFMIGIKQNK